MDNNILKSTSINNEVKLWYILLLLHDEEISLYKAGELCQEAGLFLRHWIEIDIDLAFIKMEK